MPYLKRSASLVTAKDDVEMITAKDADFEDVGVPTEVSAKNSMAQLAHFKPSILPLLNRVCCAGYCSVRIGLLLRLLPAIVLAWRR